MKAEEIIARVEASSSLNELHLTLQDYIEAKGFAAFSFIDNSQHGESDPLVLNSISADWDRAYRDNQFLDVDPCLPIARTSNTPFTWSDLPPIERRGRRKPRAQQLMDAAQDHDYRNGLVIPFHYRDRLGAYYSSVCTLFWTTSPRDFVKRLRFDRHEMHMVLLYWAQQAVDVSTKSQNGSRVRPPNQEGANSTYLTEREKEVLLWSALGKTSADTADILQISKDTVDSHIKSSIEKLDATNRTHAVVRAIFLGLIMP
ncbi:helix-turn-helix transcriptional regulator [Amorphus coralli]|uniref:helix-turn-helix transcriptional regulator n=1 Tax=Amorphus coralli TaxID=340680 RepID=UPI00036274EE|nr:LuxR family transcriptional regulator [Amorphus coralli]